MNGLDAARNRLAVLHDHMSKLDGYGPLAADDLHAILSAILDHLEAAQTPDVDWKAVAGSAEAGRAFDRRLAAHDAELREQIAREIEDKLLGADFGRNPATGADSPDTELHAAFDEGLALAAHIARGEKP